MRDSRSLMLRRQNAARIAVDPVDLVLTRREKVDNGAGGFKLIDSDLPPQRCRLVRNQRGQGVIQTNEARAVKEEWLLQSLPGFDVQLHDQFSTEIGEWEVTSIVQNNDEGALCGVTLRGPDGNA